MPLNNPITPALLADPEVFQQNRLPFHAHFADQTSPEMPLTVSLDGEWAFRYAENLTAPFSDWDTLTVPGFIQMQSLQKPGQPYGAPHYVNTQYPWDGHEKLHPGEIPQDYNPIGEYQRNFTLPENLFSGLVMLAVSIMTSTLTTRVKKQEQLRMETEREKMRANLLRAVSHDLRTPLTSIYGACSTVTENYDSLGKEQALKLLREACEDAQWLNRMVENLLSVTRFDGEQVAVKKTPTVLEELLDTVLVKFKKRCPDVPIQLELPEDFVMIPMDSMLIQQVLMNLLENAVLHAEGMTTLTLRVFTLGQRAVFEVIDNGCGIPKERLKTLFTGTTLTQDTSSGGKHGMGIGLSVCAAIIKAHGGEIDAESRPGEGTTIRFWLETEKIELEDAEDEQ